MKNNKKNIKKLIKRSRKKIKDIIETTTADKQQEELQQNQFPPHPILARRGEIWGEIEEIIDKLPQGPVKDKIRAVFETKRKLAEKQKYYTDLFLETTTKYMPGGYDGWNEELKGALRYFLETSPYFASLFKEPNCIGRTILLSGMLMEAQVFEEKDLVTMATYNHAFLGSFDALGVGRVIEGSGNPIHSYFGIPKEKVFQGKVFDDQEIILQLPLQVGLLTEAGISYSNRLEKQKAKELRLYLLQQSGYIRDLLWNNLFIDLDNLDYFFGLSHPASINNLYPTPFYLLLYYSQGFTKALEALEQEKSSPLLLPYIKLNLLVMQKALNDEKNAEELIIRLNDKLKGKSEEEVVKKMIKETIEKMKQNLETLLSQLNNIEIPDYWKNKYGPNLESENTTIEQMREDLWNPDLFPKPIAIDDKGNVRWQMPQ
jgi:hypothetical protein